MGDLANEFSWSRSRDGAFQECKRRYFYHYYGAWGGWDAAVAPEVRRLYILKQLASRQQWAGRTVHDAIELALHGLRDGRSMPVEPFVADVGSGDPASQLACYALYARDLLGVEPKTVDLYEVNLREPHVTAHRWDDERLAAVREQLRLSIRGMKAYLADAEANVAVLTDFERTEDLRICRWCNFRAVCRPEL